MLQWRGFLWCVDDLDSTYSKEDAQRDMNLGFRAALWMALCGFVASGIIRNVDVLDKGAIQLQEAGLQALHLVR